MAQSLTAKAGIVTTDFGRGVQEIREKLKQLNTSLEENKQELKTAAKEANNLRKAQQELAAQMENGGTDEQKRQMKRLSDQLAQVNARIGTLRASESELRGAVRNANRELDEQYDNTTKLTGSTHSFANAIKAVIAAAATKTLTEWLFGSNAEMEQYLTSFTVMLGDAEKAKKLMEDLTNFAATTPLEMDDVIKASEMLMNYGVSADDVIMKMTQLGDLSSGNAAKLDRVTLAYGQMLAKGKVTNEELRQMIEAGVPLLQALADTMGVTTGEVQDLASKSKIGIDQLDAAIASLTSDGGKFAGMMDKQSQTFQGMLSNAHDTIERIGRDVGAQAFEELKDTFSDLLEKVQELEEDGSLKRWATDAGKAVADLTSGFIDLTGFVLDNKEAVIALVAAYATMRGVSAIISNVENAQKSLAATAGAMKLLNTDLKGLPSLLAPAGKSLLGIGKSLGTIVSTGGLVAASVAAIGISVNSLVDLFTLDEKVQNLKDRTEELKNTTDDSIISFIAESQILRTKADAYEELRGKTDRTAAEEERLKSLAEELQGVLGSNCEVVNSLTGEYNGLSGAVEDYIKKQSEKIRMDAMAEKAKEAYKMLDEIDRQMEKRSEEHAKSSEGWFGELGKEYAAALQENMSGAWSFESVLTRSNPLAAIAFSQISHEQNKFLNDMKALREQKPELQKIIDEYEEAIGKSFEEVANDSEAAEQTVFENARSTAKSLEEIEEAVEECRKSTDTLTKSAKTLSSAFSEQQNDGALSADTILSLVDAGYAAALAVDAETGAVKLDAEAYRKLAEAKLAAQKADISVQRREKENIYAPQIASAYASGNYDLGKSLEKKLKEETANLDAQLMAIDSINLDKVISGEYGSSSKSTKTATLPETYTKGKKDLKYKYDMGDISEDEYYDKLYELMRSSGISENSDEWRSIDVEKKKSGDKSTAKKTKSGVTEIESAMKSLSDAFSEQKKNAELSVSSVEKLIDLGFEEALSIDETTGKITLKGEKIDELLDKQIAAAQKEVAADGKTTAGAKAKAAMLDTLADKYNDVKNGVFGVIAAETNFTDINKAFKEASDERIKQIDKELEAKKKASNDAIAAIDAEIQARKRAKEDDDIQSEIDAVNAQLKYAQLDEFSRAQLERQLQNLYNQQADTAWERNAEDRKAAINNSLNADEEAADAQKEALNEATDTMTDALNSVADGIALTAEQITAASAALQTVLGNLSAGSASSAPSITNNITTNGGETTNNNTFAIGTENYTAEQLVRIIFDALGNPTI